MTKREYTYCPFCATTLEQRTLYGRARTVCPDCGFVHFQDPKVAVIALVTHQNKVLLVQRAVEPQKGKWTLPGGYMDAGEMPREALQRELHEEVALDVKILDLLDIFPMASSGGRSPGIVLAFQARPADDQRIGLICADDACDARWFLPGEVPSELAFESTHALLARWQRQG
jgi:ADP-ribose pyrophosphatase YjhB (NUDIX family)